MEIQGKRELEAGGKVVELDRSYMVESIESMIREKSLDSLRSSAHRLMELSESHDWSKKPDPGISRKHLESDLQQIIDAYSIERSRYYAKRLLKSLKVIRKGKNNDINLNRWKEYDDILTDSLWIEKNRDRSGGHNAGYWGNFIPQIPNQLIRRFTREGEWVLDTFSGSGTTLMECRKLNRNGVGIDISRNAIDMALDNLEKTQTPDLKSRIELVQSNSTEADFEKILESLGIGKVQLIIMHPPYWDIIRFTEEPGDLSHAVSIDGFLSGIRKVANQAHKVLEKGRYLALVMGDKYSEGEWIPLGFRSMNEVLQEKFRLKSIIVKNFESTRGKQKQKDLWRYRALAGGFYVFKHEYIFLFQA